MGFFEKFKPAPSEKRVENMEPEDVGKITDQSRLANIAENGPVHLSHVAIEKLDAKRNQDLLLRIAFNNGRLVYGAQSTAIKKLQELDPEVWQEAYAELAHDHDLFLNDRTLVLQALGRVGREKYQNVFADVVGDVEGGRLTSRSVALQYLDKEKPAAVTAEKDRTCVPS